MLWFEFERFWVYEGFSRGGDCFYLTDNAHALLQGTAILPKSKGQ